LKTDIDSLTQLVIGAAMAVHRALGPGFLESVYQKALAVELKSLGISFREQAPRVVVYRGEVVGEFVADIVVEDGLIVELKSTLTLATMHEVQLVNYLSATGIEHGLLINFGAPSLEFRRKFKNPKNPVNLVNPVKKTAARTSAFSLIELMVAMAVMSLLLVLLLNMVDSGTKLWRVNENRVDSYREARAALGIISRDLQNLIPSTNASHFLINGDAFPSISSVGGVVTNTNSGSAVFFLSALPAKAQQNGSNKSDVCQVGYFLAFNRTSASTNQSLNLYRYFRSSDPTFQTLTNGTGLFASPPPFPNSADTELLARNVTGIALRAFTLTNSTLVAFSSSSSTPVPDLVEIQIRAINQDAAKKLDNNVSSWTNSASPVIAPVEQTFTTRVKLNRGF
jgi:GxxExxY protein